MAKETQVATPNRRPQPTRRRSMGPAGNPRQWWAETRAELRKVTWPSPEQTRNLTLVVIAVCLVMATFLGVVDAILSGIVGRILGL